MPMAFMGVHFEAVIPFLVFLIASSFILGVYQMLLGIIYLIIVFISGYRFLYKFRKRNPYYFLADMQAKRVWAKHNDGYLSIHIGQQKIGDKNVI